MAVTELSGGPGMLVLFIFFFYLETLQNRISEEFAHHNFPYSKHYFVHFFIEDIPPSLKKKNSSKTKRPLFGQICLSLSHVESY